MRLNHVNHIKTIGQHFVYRNQAKSNLHTMHRTEMSWSLPAQTYHFSEISIWQFCAGNREENAVRLAAWPMQACPLWSFEHPCRVVTCQNIVYWQICQQNASDWTTHRPYPVLPGWYYFRVCTNVGSAGFVPDCLGHGHQYKRPKGQQQQKPTLCSQESIATPPIQKRLYQQRPAVPEVATWHHIQARCKTTWSYTNVNKSRKVL